MQRYVKISEECILDTTLGRFIDAPVITIFSANINPIIDETPSIIHWEVTGTIGEVRLNGQVAQRNNSIEHWSDHDQVFKLEVWLEDLLVDERELEVQVMVAPPEIQYFRASQNFVIQGFPIELSWSTENTRQVEISGLGIVPSIGSRFINVQDTGCFQLTATGSFSNVETARLNMPMMQTPRIETLRVPVPEINLNLAYGFNAMSIPDNKIFTNHLGLPEYEKKYTDLFGKQCKTPKGIKLPSFEKIKQIFS
ncbi:MAG: hypothetical protein U0V04_03350 [Spirosomataceae bacterium]|jgi:hypothetical protein